MTCAHLIGDTHHPPTEPVFVDFQFLANSRPVPADVVAEYWHPERAQQRVGDVAVLRLRGPAPSGAQPAPLRMAYSIWEHPFSTYGYPRGHEDGVWSRGTLVGGAGRDRLQLQAESQQGHPLQKGFSGAPIWDEHLQAIVGIVVTKDKLQEARSGYGIPVEAMCRVWPDLLKWVGWRLGHDPSFTTHWSPRSRGVERDSRRGRYFTGRSLVLTELSQWLEQEQGDPAIQVVTGAPGSGKSAVLGRLLSLSDPQFRAALEREDPHQLGDVPVLPAVGRISAGVHVAGLNLAAVTRQIASAVSEDTEEPSALISHLQHRGQPFVLVVDALDEAASLEAARDIASRLLVPLAQDLGVVGSKVLVGTRRGPNDLHLRSLGSQAAVLDLDDPRYFELDDLIEYAARQLRLEHDSTNRSPYMRHPDVTEKVATAIARRAQPSFLVAGLAARSRAEDRQVIDVSVPGWENSEELPADVNMAMAAYMDRFEDRERALHLLVPVAYARHPGIPRNSLLAELASEYSGRRYGPADIDWLTSTAGASLLEVSVHDGIDVMRLFHHALTDYVRSQAHVTTVERIFTSVLERRAVERGGWLHAEPYAKAHAPSHAMTAANGVLDSLVTDPAFLLGVERRGLLLALPKLTEPQAQEIGRSYRAAAHRMTGERAADAAYLELESLRRQNDSLAARIRLLDQAQPFSTLLARPHGRAGDPLVLDGHTSFVEAVAWGIVDGQAVVASGGFDGTRLWDPRDGTQLRVPTRSHDATTSLAWGTVDGRPALAEGTFFGHIRLLDPQDGRELRALRHSSQVIDLAWGIVRDRPVLASVPLDGTVCLWDPQDGTLLHVLQAQTDSLNVVSGPPSRGSVRAVCWGTLAGEPVLASTGDDGILRLWDPSDGKPIGIVGRHSHSVSALAWGVLDLRPVLASTSDRSVQVWDVTSGAQLFTIKDAFQALAWGTVDDRLVLAYSAPGNAVRLCDAESRTRLADLKGHTGYVKALAWGAQHDGAPALATAGDHTVRIWDPREKVSTSESATGDVLAVDWGTVEGASVLASGGEHGTVQLWDVSNAAELRVLKGHTGYVHALAWGAIDGRAVLASVGQDGVLRIWDPTKGVQLIELPDLHSASSLAWAAPEDGQTVLASAGSWGVRIWDVRRGKRVLEVGRDTQLVTLAWGELAGFPVLASAGEDRIVHVWDPRRGSEVRRLEGHRDWVRALAWGSLDGKSVLASAGQDNTIRLWDIDSAIQLQCLEGHPNWISSLAWGVLGERSILVSGGHDHTVRVWDPLTQERAAIPIDGMIRALSMEDGCLAVGGSSGLDVLRLNGEVFSNHRTGRKTID